jgi:two-component system, OmpR family, response regulator
MPLCVTVFQKVNNASVGTRPRDLSSPTYTLRSVGTLLRCRPCATGRMRPVIGGRAAASRVSRRARVELRTYIVEDNVTIRENLVDALQELASVQTLGWAETENDAKTWMAGHRGQWDLLIVDLFLKQGSGLGVLEASQGRGREQRVVVLSNYATPDMRKRCAQLGADAVFDKSNEIDALVDYCLAIRARPPG